MLSHKMDDISPKMPGRFPEHDFISRTMNCNHTSVPYAHVETRSIPGRRKRHPGTIKKQLTYWMMTGTLLLFSSKHIAVKLSGALPLPESRGGSPSSAFRSGLWIIWRHRTWRWSGTWTKQKIPGLTQVGKIGPSTPGS